MVIGDIMARAVGMLRMKQGLEVLWLWRSAVRTKAKHGIAGVQLIMATMSRWQGHRWDGLDHDSSDEEH